MSTPHPTHVSTIIDVKVLEKIEQQLRTLVQRQNEIAATQAQLGHGLQYLIAFNQHQSSVPVGFPAFHTH